MAGSFGSRTRVEVLGAEGADVAHRGVFTTTKCPGVQRQLNSWGLSRWRRRDERGAATVVVVFLAVALLAGAGLVIDGGYALAGRRQAMNQAEQTARVASDKLSEAGLRSGATRVDDSPARAAAQAYLAGVGARGTVTIAGGRVTVTVRDHYRPAILSMVGVDSINVAGTATAVSIDNDDAP